MKYIFKILIVIFIIGMANIQLVYAEETVAGFDASKLKELELEDIVNIKLSNLESKREQLLKENGLDSGFTDEEIEILERITEAEAESEGLIGKILVVNVIMNRLKDDRFENSVKDIVFAKKQFQPIRDGRYKKVTVTNETKYAVSLVIDFDFSISDEILFFHALKSKGFSNYTKLFTYKGHVFYTY